MKKDEKDSNDFWRRKLTLKLWILALFDTSPLHRFSKFNNFLWVCWFLGKNISNFEPAAWKLDNPYYHIDCSFLCVFFQKFLPCFQEFLIYWQIFFQFFYLNNNKSKQIQNHSKLLKRQQNIKLPFQISSGCFQFCPRHYFRHLALL